MRSEPEKLLKRHRQLVHSDLLKISSHVPREQGDWYVNTLLVDGCEIPFKYKRKRQYKSLKGQRVNLTYYPATESVAGIDFEIMKVVRIRVA